MTVQQLLDLLQDKDPDAEVRIISQQSWPFENSIRGIAIREDFAETAECQCDRGRTTDPHDAGCPAIAGPTFPAGCAASDVFIVEGDQERYGSKAAWDVCWSC